MDIEKDAKQANHVNWLKLGDNNTPFFGMKAQECQIKNSLFKLTN